MEVNKFVYIIVIFLLQNPNKEINYNNSTHFNDKQKNTNIESNIVDHTVSKKNIVLNRPELCTKNKLKSFNHIRNGFKVKQRESGYFKSKRI